MLLKRLQIDMLAWCKPPQSHFKLNVNGSRSCNGLFGAGGVIRNDTGTWISDLMLNIGSGVVVQAEVWFFLFFSFLFFHGLQLAFELKTNQIYVDSDSGVLVDLIQNENVALHLLGTLIENCRHLMESW